MDEHQESFMDLLDEFIERVKGLRQFRGKAHVLRSLERIRNLSVFN